MEKEPDRFHSKLLPLFISTALDMSLPTYEIQPGETGYKFKHYAGREILEELQRIRKSVPAVIITQFDVFGTGETRLTFAELEKELTDKFPRSFQSIIFYSASEEAWKEGLLAAINRMRA